jgi:transposase
MCEVLKWLYLGTFIALFQTLPDRDNKGEWICTDMWRPFKRTFYEYLPNTKLVLDKFLIFNPKMQIFQNIENNLQKKHIIGRQN